MWNSIKTFFANLYFTYGRVVGVYLLKSIGIAAVCIIVLHIAVGTPVTFSGLLEWLLALPLISIIVTLVRLALYIVHLIIPMRPGLLKIIVDFVIFAAVLLAVSFLIEGLALPDSTVLEYILISVFDVAYIVGMVLLFKADKLAPEAALEEDQTESID